MPYGQSEHRVFAFRHQGGVAPQPSQNSRSGSVSQGNRCWNCQAIGHPHSLCPEPKTGIFCYRCGSRGVITSRCQRCLGNGRAETAGGPAADAATEN